MSLERRRAPRYAIVADAEITEIRSNTKLSAKTSDLSAGGCFVYALSPFPNKSEVLVKISANGGTFTAAGTVVFALPNMGMGVAFSSVADDQLAVLKEWVSGLSPMA